MAGNRTHYLPLLENEFCKAFCAYGEDFMPFRGEVLHKNLFKNFCEEIKTCVFMDQIHSNVVRIYPDEFLQNKACDGLITSQKNVALCVLSADCLPLLLWHKKGYIAALHSGRKGSFEKILSKAVQKIQHTYKVENDFSLLIAPSICVKNYEIGGEILEFAKEHFEEFLQANKLDLKAMIKAEARNLGIKDIIDCEICSFEDERFFSYRRDKTLKRFVSVIVLKA